MSTERKMLLATIAFSGWALGQLALGVSSLIAVDSAVNLQRISSLYYCAWQAAAAILLIMASRCTTLDDKQRCRSIGLRAMIVVPLLSLPVSATAIVICKSWPRLQEAFPGSLAIFIHRAFQLAFSSNFMCSLALAAFGAAFLVFVGDHIRHEDTFSSGITRCLLLAMSGQAAALISEKPGDLAWWASYVFSIGGLLVLTVALGGEFGVSYVDSRAKVEHLEAVHYISSRLNNTLDLRVVLLAFVSDTANLLGARFASIMLADDSGEALTTTATYGLPDMPLEPRKPQPVEGKGRPAFYSGHTAKAFKQKRVCLVDDVYTDVEFIPWKLLSKYDGYTVSVPLIYHEIALGVMNLFFDKHIPMNAEKIKLFETLAAAAAVSIANAQMYDRSLQAESDGPDILLSRLAS